MSADHHSPNLQSQAADRAKALEELLIKKGLVDPRALDDIVDTYENRIGPRIGAQVVARAWTDPVFKRRLLANGAAAVRELGVDMGATPLIVVENTSKVHNLIVCTLCSCYPWAVLGLPPVWYKSFAYRSRAVSEPRAVLRDFGLELPAEVEIRVWDSSAEVRYMVLPQRPAGTAHLSEEELAAIVNRDAMVGVAKVGPPAARKRRSAAAQPRA